MASQTSKSDRKAVPLAEFVADIERRRAALGREIEMPRNSGKRRTESKKVLLAAIAELGGNW
jgi:hypothetical protein